MRVMIDNNPLAPSNIPPSDFRTAYSARPAWIAPKTVGFAPEVTAYRLRFELAEAGVIRAHVSADERYQLFLDGQRVGRGPERGSDRAWFYETYDLDLSSGAHMLTALVWRLGEIGPLAQIGLTGGFLLEAEGPFGESISTKAAAWETRPVDGISFSMPVLPGKGAAWFVEPVQTTDGAAYPWGVELGTGEGWVPAEARREDFAFPFGIMAGHVLQPAMLPAQMASVRQGGTVRHAAEGTWNDVQFAQVNGGASLAAEVTAWQAMLDGRVPVVVPPRSRRQVIIDLEEYVCAYPQIQLSGGSGSQVIIGWAEALHLDASGHDKGQRDEVEGRTFIALCRDTVIADGGEQRLFEPLWWRSGRYIELLIESGDLPLTVEAFNLLETRYPLEMVSRFNSSDARLDAVIPVAARFADVRARNVYGLPLLRADDVCRRFTPGGADHLRHQRR
jgi:alpha-L-rhamnosidase